MSEPYDSRILTLLGFLHIPLPTEPCMSRDLKFWWHSHTPLLAPACLFDPKIPAVLQARKERGDGKCCSAIVACISPSPLPTLFMGDSESSGPVGIT